MRNGSSSIGGPVGENLRYIWLSDKQGLETFTPLMAGYARVEPDGVLSLDDGEVVWHWPND